MMQLSLRWIGAICLVFALSNQVFGRGGGFHGGYGSVRFFGAGGYWNDDEAWNAGFNGGTNWDVPKQVATVSGNPVLSDWRPGPVTNRVNSQAYSAPINYGSIQHNYFAGHMDPGAASPAPVGSAAGNADSGAAALLRPAYGGRILSALPEGFTSSEYQGATYYSRGFKFYRPYWYAGAVSYWPVAPPVGWFFPIMPESAIPQVIGGTTYFVLGDLYFTAGTRNGENGFVVAPTPAEGGGAAGTADPRKLFQAMSEYLGNQPQLTITTNDTYEQLTTGGAKYQLSTQQTSFVERPNRAMIEVSGDNRVGRIWYADKTLTVLDVKNNLYGMIPATGSFDSVLDTLAMDYSMAVPGDWLYPDLYQRMAERIQSSRFLGVESVGGNKCNHLLFGLKGVDWELWIQKGDLPIPRKMVVSYSGMPSRPRYIQEITGFNTGPIPASEFKLELPAGAHKIDFLPTRSRPGTAK